MQQFSILSLSCLADKVRKTISFNTLKLKRAFFPSHAQTDQLCNSTGIFPSLLALPQPSKVFAQIEQESAQPENLNSTSSLQEGSELHQLHEKAARCNMHALLC